MIEARNLRKTYGSQVAVDDLSFDVRPGLVSGFLGPDGAGKSSTIRLMLGLDHGGGQTRFEGVPYRRLNQPMRVVGAVGDARAFHPGRRARSHLRMLAAAQGITRERVDEVLEWVGLAVDVADRRLRTFSIGMSQRLALGAALLGDPRVLILDEPTEGLDPAGAKWLRGFLRAFAAEGRIVFVSGNDVSALAQTADHLVVIEKGRLVADEPTAVFVGRHGVGELVLVRTPHLERLGRLLSATGARVRRAEDHQLAVSGLDLATVGDLAFPQPQPSASPPTQLRGGHPGRAVRRAGAPRAGATRSSRRRARRASSRPSSAGPAWTTPRTSRSRTSLRSVTNPDDTPATECDERENR